MTTIQDLGRAGHRAFGVPPCGAMDRFALAAANRLVGNIESAPALECALTGPALLTRRPCLVAITGGDFTPAVNGNEIPSWTGIYLAEGDRLSFGPRRSGARVYVAVAGGFSGQRWLGSASTYLLIGRGGHEGRTLKAGDRLLVAGPGARPLVAGRHAARRLRPHYGPEPVLDAVPGPHHGRLTGPSRAALFRAKFEVTREADRMGYRLRGPDLEVTGRELISLGLTMGAVQLPPGGQPILLMADHQTAGGYPIILGVSRSSLPLAAQLLPGDHLSFRQVTVTDAQQAWRELRGALDQID